MKKHKEINSIYNGAPYNMVGDGFRVTNYFPNGNDFNSGKFGELLIR